MNSSSDFVIAGSLFGELNSRRQFASELMQRGISFGSLPSVGQVLQRIRPDLRLCGGELGAQGQNLVGKVGGEGD
jgi:hypothetical protein